VGTASGSRRIRGHRSAMSLPQKDDAKKCPERFRGLNVIELRALHGESSTGLADTRTVERVQVIEN